MRRSVLIWFLGIVGLVICGVCYRLSSEYFHRSISVPAKLTAPLSEFPLRVEDWVGTDVSIRETVLETAGNDDYLNRLYKNDNTNEQASVYVAYTTRPQTMLGHRPRVCYKANRWIHDGTEQVKIISSQGHEIPCLLHRFHKPAIREEQVTVLNFYIVNGEFTDDEGAFSGLSWRRPSGSKDIASLAQVQISSTLENSARALVVDMAGMITDYLALSPEIDEFSKIQLDE